MPKKEHFSSGVRIRNRINLSPYQKCQRKEKLTINVSPRTKTVFKNIEVKTKFPTYGKKNWKIEIEIEKVFWVWPSFIRKIKPKLKRNPMGHLRNWLNDWRKNCTWNILVQVSLSHTFSRNILFLFLGFFHIHFLEHSFFNFVLGTSLSRFLTLSLNSFLFLYLEHLCPGFSHFLSIFWVIISSSPFFDCVLFVWCFVCVFICCSLYLIFDCVHLLFSLFDILWMYLSALFFIWYFDCVYLLFSFIWFFFVRGCLLVFVWCCFVILIDLNRYFFDSLDIYFFFVFVNCGQNWLFCIFVNNSIFHHLFVFDFFDDFLLLNLLPQGHLIETCSSNQILKDTYLIKLKMISLNDCWKVSRCGSFCWTHLDSNFYYFFFEICTICYFDLPKSTKLLSW